MKKMNFSSSSFCKAVFLLFYLKKNKIAFNWYWRKSNYALTKESIKTKLLLKKRSSYLEHLI